MSAQAQQVQWKGVVLDSLSQGIPNVTIREKGTSNKVQTDAQGQFQIRTSSTPGVFVFQHLGFQRLEKSFNKPYALVTVILPPLVNEIASVNLVNTGYEALSRERSTGSFEHINNADLATRTGFGILEKIEGLAPSLQFDNRSGTPVLTMRGISTMVASRMEPLVILDNFPYTGDLDNINPNDIESVTLLKDAAATSIWGARAGNGVIVITSKKAKRIEKSNISFSSNLNMLPKPNLWSEQRVRTSDFIDVELFLFEKNHYSSTYTGSRKKTTIFSPIVDMLYAHKNGTVSQDELESAIAGFREIDYLEEVQNIFYRPSIRQQHHFSVSSSTSRLSNRFSVGFDSNKRAKIGEVNNRLTGSMNSKFVWSSKFDVDFSFSYSNSSESAYYGVQGEKYSPGGGRTSIYPYVRFRDENGVPVAIPNTYNFEYINSLKGGALLDWTYVPLNDIGTSNMNDEIQHVQGQVGFTWKPITGLTITNIYNLEKQVSASNTIKGEESYEMRDLINRFTQIKDQEVKYILPLGASRSDAMSNLSGYNVRGQVNYHKTMYDKHDVSAITGGEFSHKGVLSKNFMVYGYDEGRMLSQPVDHVNSYPIYDGLGSNARIPSSQSYSKDVQRYVSVYGNIGYLYNDRYGFSFSARKDASNLFGVRSNDRWKPLWSAGLIWNITNESFLKAANWVDRLTLRATYGHSGNSGGAANYLPTIAYVSSSSTTVASLPSARVAKLSNPDLRWETVTTINIGFDFSLFNNALNGHVEAYRKKSTDLLEQDMIDITTGSSTITRNVASLAGKGAELRLSGTYRLWNFTGKTTINSSYTRTRVQEMYGTVGLGKTYADNSGRSMRPLIDRELYPVFSFKFAGLNPDTGDPRGIYKGEASENYAQLINDSLQNLTYHGTALPPFYGSFIQEFNIGRLSVSFLFAFKFGHYFQKKTIQYNSLFNNWGGHTDFEKRWQKSGDEFVTDIPSMVYPAVANRDAFFASSDANILEGDLIRLKDINISYKKSLRIRNRLIACSFFAKANGGTPVWIKNKFKLDSDYFSRAPERRYSLGVNLEL